MRMFTIDEIVLTAQVFFMAGYILSGLVIYLITKKR